MHGADGGVDGEAMQEFIVDARLELHPTLADLADPVGHYSWEKLCMALYPALKIFRAHCYYGT